MNLAQETGLLICKRGCSCALLQPERRWGPHEEIDMLSLSIRVPLTCSRRYILHHPSSASRCARSESELMLVASLLLGALTLVCASETPGCAQGIAGRKTEIVV